MWLAAVLALSVEPYVALGDSEQSWTIADDITGTQTPNIRSELIFDDIETYYLGLRGDASMALPWFGLAAVAEGRIAWGSTQDGTAEDFDYNGNQRTELYSLSEAEIRGDDAWELTAGLGVRIPLSQESAATQQSLTLSVGGFRYEQTLNFHRGQQLIADPDEFSVPIEDLTENLQQNLDSDYFSEWSGAWLGANYQWQTAVWSLSLRAQYYHGAYYGEGRWNLRATGIAAFQQPKSFSHQADADGVKLAVAMGYALTPRWWLTLQIEKGEWESETGLALTYFADQSLGATRFNGAQWQSKQLQLGLDFQF